MSESKTLLSERIVTPMGIVNGGVVIRGEQIADVLERKDLPSAGEILDFGSAVIMPGLVDSHVHVNEPGRTDWEGFETATQAAAKGGITTIIDMPLNCDPVTTTRSAFQKKLDSTTGKLWVDCGFYGGVIPGNANQLESLADMGVLGCKAFLIHSGLDEFPNVKESDLHEAMPILKKRNLPLLVHAELATSDPSPVSDNQSYYEYLQSRPKKWENDAVELMVELTKQHGTHVHIVHLSSSESLSPLKRAREQGLRITVETCPHYLIFDADQIASGLTEFKCAPPIREAENRDALWEGLRKAEIDFIVSDHSPCTPDLKLKESGDFTHAWGGIASLQFGLSSIWTEASSRGFELPQIAKWLCEKPAETFGLRNKGKIEPGFDADLVVWDPNLEYTVRPEAIAHRHKLTPYLGRKLKGRVLGTFLRGNKIYDDTGIIEEPCGKHLLREKR